MFQLPNGRDVGSALPGLRFVSVPVGRSDWRVLVSCRSWLLPGSFHFLRECFSLTSGTDKGADPITVHFCQVYPVYYCSGGSWAANFSLSSSGYCRLFSVPLGSPFFGVLTFVRQWLQLQRQCSAALYLTLFP